MAVDYYLRIDGIPGESADPNFPNQIKLFSWSLGESISVAANGTPGKSNFSDFSVMKQVDVATPLLMRACALGTQIKSATLSGIKVGSDTPTQPYLQIQFQNLHVSSDQQSASSEDPSESFSFQYAVIKYSYTIQTTDGTPPTTKTFGFNTITHVTVT